MGYDSKKWTNRMRLRSDMSCYVTHLTRASSGNGETGYQSGIDHLLQILREKKIRGSHNISGFINGAEPAVCFQDMPLNGVSQNVLHEQMYREDLGGKTRYEANGLSFTKGFIFEKGGRPVFYEKTHVAKKILPKEEWWRIVNFDLSNKNRVIDWTHEREWRVKGDIEFEYEHAFILVANDQLYREFISKAEHEILENIRGITVLQHVLY
jgi:hypothetical protein